MIANGHITDIDVDDEAFWVNVRWPKGKCDEQVYYAFSALAEDDIVLGQMVHVDDDYTLTAIHFPPWTQEEIEDGEQRANEYAETMGWKEVT